MYTTHFGLTATPFSLTPDPHYLYLSERHREALAHLLYGVNENAGFILLSGEVGTGKTTLCRCLIEQLPKNVDVALLLNPRVSPLELLASLFDELRISYDRSFSLKNFIDTLNNYLLTAHAVGRKTILILDEAQNLSPDVLEQVRLLTNLETNSQKLLQIILVGQPELNQILKRNNLRQLAQRITARYHLLPLSLKDTQAYINHRLAISGARRPLFNRPAIHYIYQRTGGIPRLINIICDRSLLGGYVNNKTIVDLSVVRKAVREVRGEHFNPYVSPQWVGGIAVLLVVSALSGWAVYQYPNIHNFFQSSEQTTAETPKTPTLPAENTLVSKPSLPAVTTTSSALPIVTSHLSPIHRAVDASQPIATTPPVVTPPPTVTTTAPQVNTDVTTSTPASDDILSTLKNANTLSDTKTAFDTLFALWGMEYEKLAGTTACDKAASQGWACFYKAGTWDDIRRLNSPTVIELNTEDGKQYHVVVTRLDQTTATLNFGGQSLTYMTKTIDRFWAGQLLTLWKPPRLPVTVLKRGMSGDDVLWLRERLNRIQNLPAEPNPSATFDSTLKQKVLTFQRQYGLSADGVVGETTFLKINALLNEKPLFTLSNNSTQAASPSENP
ncbi:type II secretory pathway, component ExeA (predicted ATPase) [Beggiatoa alba B18LD]|uniref:Type II secretory pathway, component ExeA (Predicted ATPase) n=1 Tax=Beggiatoa alba B18LD TaxID=395493 RepID=I3CHH1_9GAMM|nr:ExeA family protein [Beggiatoa alba]EIJ43064.1 type II secretory pathway, component ExeA (predicted ATPase) [Beggiatoa alba B18LD]